MMSHLSTEVQGHNRVLYKCGTCSKENETSHSKLHYTDDKCCYCHESINLDSNDITSNGMKAIGSRHGNTIFMCPFDHRFEESYSAVAKSGRGY
jgi:DNA-directed RNA polymerase subunit RPC12/RpoP